MSDNRVTQQDIQKDYKRLAQHYDERWRRFNGSAYSWVLDRAFNVSGVMDLGCGTGRLLELIHEKYPDAALNGIDVSDEMLTIARHRLPEAKLIKADILDHKIKGQYGVVLSINVLHHLNDVRAHISSLKELCAENGSVFLCDFAINTLSLNIAELYWRAFLSSHHRAYSKEKLCSILEEQFEIVDNAQLKPDKFWCLQIYQLRPII